MSRKPNGFWKKMTNETIVKHFNENYSDYTRQKLKKENQSFYAVIIRRPGLIDRLIPENRQKNFINWKDKTDEELVDYFKTHYVNLNRKQLEKKACGFYQALKSRTGLLDKTLPSSRQKWKDKTDEELADYVKKNYSGWTRSQIKRKNQGLYSAINSREGLIDKVIPSQFQQSWSKMSDEQLLDYVRIRYPNHTRTQLREEGSIYNAILSRDGLIDRVIQAARKNWEKMTNSELIDYFKKNYPDFTRKQLQTEDGGFYCALKSRELLELLLPSLRLDFEKKTDLEIIDYVKNHYKGHTPEMLSRKSKKLYRIIEERSLTSLCFTKRNNSLDSVLESYVMESERDAA